MPSRYRSSSAREAWRTVWVRRRRQGARRGRNSGKKGVLSSAFVKIDRAALKKEYTHLQAQLARAGWISQGYVQDRGPGAGGPHYQWTRKERGKTVSVALSPEQFAALAEAIRNWREVERILDRMQQLTRQFIFGTLPDTRRRKPLSKKVLGLN